MRALIERFIAPLRYSPICRAVPSGFQRDVPGKSLGDDHINLAAADVVAFDEATIIEFSEIALAQDAPRLAHLFQTFGFFDPDIEESNRWSRNAEKDRCCRSPHQCEIDQMIRLGADRGS